ncbi:bifunctional UDP-N-acetylglucosamine diphosphorylase/glucosamine-1-phosphate N-acetyltransferase GlmU [Carnobacteriaceae bacterium zg-ZUI252]|nr:bifunctional UDP-N-acetylglucosamine diphosphorylase/glucosamine-1-phosphate N-acetyltransferase GlmU [Carnobacteriaceae bacterium zg-ZUI252]MBS4769888.1 bifunctional UDP-N-acetylglucosamine diphosphorylase/glucosamine-1-phosphate N-acetyltransferase GlmU [Carnobacteriaceae bacterium zg-ZUI240]
MNKFAIILAAGKGTRMKSKLYKVLHPVCGKPMVEHVVKQVELAGADKIVTVVGYGADAVKELLQDRVQYALQKEQLGTGHAVKQAKPMLANQEGVTIVLCGDTPLITERTIQEAMHFHHAQNAKATILTAIADDPTGYGRVVRDENGFVVKNVEHKDANAQELAIKEINTGTYVFDNALLFEVLEEVTNNNAQGEYYLPDVIELLKNRGEIVTAYQLSDFSESLGVNDRVALAQAQNIMQKRINREHMLNGVTLVDPDNTYIESRVVIGEDTVIEPGVFLKGKTRIGKNCFVSMNSEIIDSTLEDNVSVRSSSIEQSYIDKGADVGPMAHIRPNSRLGKRVHVGNFVEVKNSTIGDDTKMGHLTYIGDATLGERINIGCGTIIVNYDGKYKHHSTIGDDSFIGCNANIVSPVEIGQGAFIAAGSTITKDVPANALAIARSRQENKEDYVSSLPYMKNQ